MEKAGDKLYHYQQTPPEGVWDKIAARLEEKRPTEKAEDKLFNYQQTPPESIWHKVELQLNNDSGKVIYLSRRKKFKRIVLLSSVAVAVALILINLVFINKTNPDNTGQTAALLQRDSISENHSLLESIIDAPEDEKLPISQSVSEEEASKYFTVMGPDGEPVKISPKVATLIISADGDFLPKPVWDKKIDDWQKIMLTSASSSSADLMDIVQKAAANIE